MIFRLISTRQWPPIVSLSTPLFGIEMGALLDSTFLISAERRGLSVAETMDEVAKLVPSLDVAISVMSVMELAHGSERADSQTRADLRRISLRETLEVLPVQQVTTAIALRAGHLDGILTKQGVRIAAADLLIGVTALELGFGVITRNTRHFEQIPGLQVLHHDAGPSNRSLY